MASGRPDAISVFGELQRTLLCSQYQGQAIRSKHHTSEVSRHMILTRNKGIDFFQGTRYDLQLSVAFAMILNLIRSMVTDYE
jgi:hypothetical protein